MAREEAPAQSSPPHACSGGSARAASPTQRTESATPSQPTPSPRLESARSSLISAATAIDPISLPSAADLAQAAPIAGGKPAAESLRRGPDATAPPRRHDSTTSSITDESAGPETSKTPKTPDRLPPLPPARPPVAPRRHAGDGSPPPIACLAERDPVLTRPTTRAEAGVRFAADPVSPGAHDRFFTGVHFFSGGQRRTDGIAGWAHIMGGTIADVDIVTGGASHDLRRPELLDRWRSRIRLAECDVTFRQCAD